jgi:hypothetical protein
VRLCLRPPWPAEYESAFEIDGFAEEDAKVDTDVEGVAWQAIEPPKQERPGVLYFIDGVRRVEARVILDDGSGRIIRGLFGSAAVGAVLVESKMASFEEIRVKRLIVAGTGILPEAELLTVGNTLLPFEPISVADTTPLGPVQGLQNLMRT